MEQAPTFLPLGYGFTLFCIAAFWLSLAAPGYVLVRRFWPQALTGGALSALALGYLFTFALITPVCALLYALRAPMAMLSSVLVVAILGSCALLYRARRSFAMPSVSWIAIVSGTIIAIDLVLGLHSGSNFGGDGRYHASRVRMLLVHGFNSWDPLVPGGRFDDVYHSNVYHAVMAASAQLTGLEAPGAWAFALFFAKLAACAATYHLVFTVFGERWTAWCAITIFVVFMASQSTLSYPNMLAAYWLIPLAAAFLVEAIAAKHPVWPALGLAATALVLPGVHGLYYVFAALVMGAVLLAALVWTRVRPVQGLTTRNLLLAMLVLGMGVPWFGVRAMGRAATAQTQLQARNAQIAKPPLPQAVTVPAVSADATDAADEADDTDEATASTAPAKRKLPRYALARAKRNRGFIDLGNGQMMFDIERFLRPGSGQLQLLLLLAIGARIGHRRRALLPLLGVTCVILVMLYVPPVCTALIKIAGAPWIVRRLSALLGVLHLAIVPALLFSLAARAIAKPIVRALCLVVGMLYAYVRGVDDSVWTRAAYLEKGAKGGSALYNGLRGHARKRALFARTVPFEATIVLPPQRSGELVMACDCYPFALGLDQSGHGIRDLDERRAATEILLGRDADLATRVALLRHYGVDRLYVKKWEPFRMLRRVYRHMLARTDTYRKDRILVLDMRRASVAIAREQRLKARDSAP